MFAISGSNISRVTSTPHPVREYHSSKLILLGPWTAHGNFKSQIKFDGKACPQNLVTQFDKWQSIQNLHTFYSFIVQEERHPSSISLRSHPTHYANPQGERRVSTLIQIKPLSNTQHTTYNQP
jgi:hypothetical protein